MTRCGDIYENKVTGEYCVILRGSDDRGDGPAYVHLLARPGAAVPAEHIHPALAERFIVVSGSLSAKIDGREMVLGPGEDALVEPGVRHDWWNASGTEEAHVVVELSGEGMERFELMITNIFGLANDGKLDSKGRPRPLQGALFGQEFADVIRFTRPPAPVQRVLFGVLAPIARRRGLRATYPQYAEPHGRTEPDPAALAAAGLADPTA
jgi:mannose-6-phosphate isomerase-like protein (cupin superfamily)